MSKRPKRSGRGERQLKSGLDQEDSDLQPITGLQSLEQRGQNCCTPCRACWRNGSPARVADVPGRRENFRAQDCSLHRPPVSRTAPYHVRIPRRTGRAARAGDAREPRASMTPSAPWSSCQAAGGSLLRSVLTLADSKHCLTDHWFPCRLFFVATVSSSSCMYHPGTITVSFGSV